MQAQQPAPFALTPAYNNRAPLTYSECRDAKVYYKGCEALEGQPYDGKGLQEFLACIATKAKQFEWM
jgi:hypothetical protein